MDDPPHSDSSDFAEKLSGTFGSESESNSVCSGVLVSGQRTQMSIVGEKPDPILSLPAYLEEYAVYFQIETFIRMVKNGGRRFSKIFSLRKSNTPILDMTESSINVQFNFMMRHQSELIPTCLLKSSSDNSNRAVKLFGLILKFTGDDGTVSSDSENLQRAQRILQQGLKRLDIRDELFVQLVKQARGLFDPILGLKLWQLFNLVTATMPPSRTYLSMISEFIHETCQDKSTSLEVFNLAKSTFYSLKGSARCGPRKSLPSAEEIIAFFSNYPLKTIIFFMDDTYEEISYNISTTIMEAVQQIANMLNLQNHKSFTLYECRRMVKGSLKEDNEEYVMLDDQSYLADALFDISNRGKEKDGIQSHLVMRKRMFRDGDEMIYEHSFINLNFIQIQHDYVSGKYPVGEELCKQLTALQLVSEYGRAIVFDKDMLVKSMERLIAKNIRPARKAEFRECVINEYQNMKDILPEIARTKFIEILRGIPYGLSTFYNVRRIEDPIGLLPSKLIIGINQRGIHFFQPVPKIFLYTVELRDIKQFGSSKHAVYFKMRLSGSLSVFNFETGAGEEICQSIQTHINDILMKRLDARGMAEKVSDEVTDDDALAKADFGEIYEMHKQDLLKKIDMAQLKYNEMYKKSLSEEYEHDQLILVLKDKQESYDREKLEKNDLQNFIDVLRRCIEQQKSEYQNIQAALLSLQWESESRKDEIEELDSSSSMYKQLEAIFQIKLQEIKALTELGKEMEVMVVGAAEERDRVKYRIDHFEKIHEEEKGFITEQISIFKNQSRIKLKEKEDELSILIEKLANITAIKNDNESDLARLKTGRMEIEDLRQLKSELEQRERMFASLIQEQNRKIKVLEEKYREEQLIRKKLYNLIEDMKGKIRVYARIRRLRRNAEKGEESNVLRLPDELTIMHSWKRDQTKEYVFDNVYDDTATQSEVFSDTKDLIQSAIDGYNVCIFAYGQTGSGKTYTIYGSKEKPGLTPKGIYHLFDCLDKDYAKYSYSISCYMLELYQDTLMDLLSPNVPYTTREKLEIKRDSNQMIWVQGATMVDVDSAEGLLKIFEGGECRRHVASTNMNRESSRSHLIMSIIINCTNVHTQATTKGKLSFVDLAGSERVKRSGSTGEHLKEAQAINKSLSALGDVVSALSRGDPHIPYRNHKLTMLMSDSLGGNSKTLMFVNVSPAERDLEETQNSLGYAMRVKTIKNDTISRETMREMANLKKDIVFWKNTNEDQVQSKIAEFL